MIFKEIIKLIRIIAALGATIAAFVLLFKWLDRNIAILITLIWYSIESLIEIKAAEIIGKLNDR